MKPQENTIYLNCLNVGSKNMPDCKLDFFFFVANSPQQDPNVSILHRTSHLTEIFYITVNKQHIAPAPSERVPPHTHRVNVTEVAFTGAIWKGSFKIYCSP